MGVQRAIAIWVFPLAKQGGLRMLLCRWGFDGVKDERLDMGDAYMPTTIWGPGTVGNKMGNIS